MEKQSTKSSEKSDTCKESKLELTTKACDICDLITYVIDEDGFYSLVFGYSAITDLKFRSEIECKKFIRANPIKIAVIIALSIIKNEELKKLKK